MMWDIFNKKKLQVLKEEAEYLKGQVHILKEDRDNGKDEIEHLEEVVTTKEAKLSQLKEKLTSLDSTIKNLSEDVETKSQALDRLLDDFKALLVQNKGKDLNCSGIRVAKEVAQEVIDLNTFEVNVDVGFYKSDADHLLRRFKSFINSEFIHDVIVQHSMLSKLIDRNKEIMIARFTIHTFDSLKKVESDILNFLYKHGTTILDQKDITEDEITIVGRAPSNQR